MLTVTAVPHQNRRLRTFNNWLTVVVVVLGCYMIVAPFAPKAMFWWRQHFGKNQGYTYASNLTKTTAPDSAKSKPLPKPPNRRLLIPSMQLDAEVYDGLYANVLDKGIWRRPKTSTPDKGGNTVLVAHRFTYNGPAVFYNLDKLKTGDKFALFWDGREYDYQVTEVKVVEPTAIQIENNTTEPILTLYTCTPMWTAKQRLVVVSKLISDTKIP